MIEHLSAVEVYDALRADPDAALVDVRTEPEWQFVGLPDLAGLGKQPVLIPWQVYPTMQVDPAFIERLDEQGVLRQAPVFFLCRSGARSHAAAEAGRVAGWARPVNVAHGFEGPPDADGHRGLVAGWKAAGLPWRQG